MFLLKIPGGTIVLALNLLKERGIDDKHMRVVNNLGEFFYVLVDRNSQIQYHILCSKLLMNGAAILQISALASPPALQKLSERFPG